MKKKSIIAILLTLVMCFGLTGCGDKISSKSIDPAVLDAASDFDVADCTETHLFGGMSSFDGVENYITLLTEYFAPENKFAIALKEEYNKAKDKNISGLGLDLIDCLVNLMDVNGPISIDEIGRVWSVGYEGTDYKSEDRALIIELPNIIPDCPYWVMFTNAKHVDDNNKTSYEFFGMGSWSEDTLKEKFGIDVSKKTGTFQYVDGKNFWGTYEIGYANNYNLVDANVIETEYQKGESLLNLLSEYYNNVYMSDVLKEKNEAEAEEEAKNAKPAIGMTKEEVENGAWGYPDDKNITEYSWGTEEQWVYENRGYIYFENGIVDAIQHR